MLNLSINELFFTLCWDLSPCSSFPALVKRISHLSSRLKFFKEIFKVWRRWETQMEVKKEKKKKKEIAAFVRALLTKPISPPSYFTLLSRQLSLLLPEKKLVQFFYISSEFHRDTDSFHFPFFFLQQKVPLRSHAILTQLYL